MTPSLPHGVPGRLLLKVAQFIFDDSVLTAVVAPTISDLQQEVRAAGDSRSARLRAKWRGYIAFWLLVTAAPVAFHWWPTRRVGEINSYDRSPGIAFGLTMVALVFFSWRFIGWVTLLVAVGGVCFAWIIHRWHDEHPSKLATPEPAVWRCPEINQSKIPVDGNIAGLMYVVGSMAIVMLGLPMLRWFFVVDIALGVACAAALVAWHGAHPRRRYTVLLT